MTSERWMVKTEAEGLEAIEIAVRIAPTAKEMAIVRLFAISMCFCRQPIGDRAQDELCRLMGPEAVAAMYFISGFSTAGRGGGWEKLAFPSDIPGAIQAQPLDTSH